MSPISEQLDAKLKTLDAKAASSLEKLVRDALELVDTQADADTDQARRLPPDFFAGIASEFGSEPFERHPQDELDERGGWWWLSCRTPTSGFPS